MFFHILKTGFWRPKVQTNTMTSPVQCRRTSTKKKSISSRKMPARALIFKPWSQAFASQRRECDDPPVSHVTHQGSAPPWNRTKNSTLSVHRCPSHVDFQMLTHYWIALDSSGRYYLWSYLWHSFGSIQNQNISSPDSTTSTARGETEARVKRTEGKLKKSPPRSRKRPISAGQLDKCVPR